LCLLQTAFKKPPEVLFTDRLPGLLGSPGGKRAPVGTLTNTTNQDSRELMIALCNL